MQCLVFRYKNINFFGRDIRTCIFWINVFFRIIETTDHHETCWLLHVSSIFRINHMELVAINLLCSWIRINEYYLARQSTQVYFQQQCLREFILLLLCIIYDCITVLWQINTSEMDTKLVTCISLMLTVLFNVFSCNWYFISILIIFCKTKQLQI